jgi:iron complex outermembrane receptor protein
MRQFKWAASCAVIASCIAAAPAFAQDTVVEEIIVTAQKREQNLQDVPIVVTVVGEQALADAGVRDVKDLQNVAPGLNVTSSTSEAQTSIRIRGVGTIGDNPGMEASVGTVIDGVYRARSGIAFGDLGEMERIEVLKGPQGTLFGKNTSAGVISVVTKEPDFEFGGSAEMTFGEWGARGASLSLTGPIGGDQLAARLYMATRKRDGFYDVSTGEGPRTSSQDQTQDYWTARAQFLLLPSDTLRIKAMVDYTDRDERCCANVSYIAGPTAPVIDAFATVEGTLRPADPYRRLAFANRDNIQRISDYGLSLQVDWDLTGDITLTSITAQRWWDLVQGADIDYSSADLWYRAADGNTFQDFNVFSQELRLAGTTERFDWLVGGFYANEQLEAGASTQYGADYEPYLATLVGGMPILRFLAQRPVGPIFPAGAGTRDRFEHESKTWALFTNNTWHATDALEVTLGLRYTDEQKTMVAHYRNLGLNPICGPTSNASICAAHSDAAFDDYLTPEQKLSEQRWGGTLKVSYRFNPDLMVYASAASGFKSGGYNLDRARNGIGVVQPDTSFDAETVKSYEIGAKSTLFNDAVLLNATAFYQEFEDFQLNTYTGISWVVANVPEVTSKGVDLDLGWRTPVDGLRFNGGVTYAVTQFGEEIPLTLAQRLSDMRLPYAPLWSVSLGGSYERPIGENLKLRASLSGKYTSSYNTGSNLAPQKIQDELTLWNGRISFGSEDELWAVELWAQNLTDEDYVQVIVDQPLQSGTFGAFLGTPRTAGVTLRSKF